MSSSSDHASQSPDMMSASPSPPPRPSGGDGRQLPTIPNNSTPYTLHQNSSKLSNQGNMNRGSNGFGPFFQEYSMMAEYTQLQQQKIPGVYVMPCAKTPLVWNGLMFIRQGLYQGAALRFTLTIPDNYPDGNCPKFAFEFPVFHPHVNPETGELDVQRAFPRWRRNVNHLWQVIVYAKRVFYKVDTKSPSNFEAATLYENDIDLFKKRLAKNIELSEQRLYAPPSLDDPLALRFSPWNDAVHGDVKKQMLQSSQRHSSDIGGSANPSDLGLSWMSSTQPELFSREDSENAELSSLGISSKLI